MKATVLYTAGLLLSACSANVEMIEVKNPLDFDRSHELVKAELSTLQPHILTDAEGAEIPYQIVDDGILFLADVPGNGSTTYRWVEGEPAPVEPHVSAFFLGKRRKDDFAWENEYAAYRMYGPALLPENPSNGVDLWLKHPSHLVADSMYMQEEGGRPYHVDYGLGLDAYKVAHTAGCGGVVVQTPDMKLWSGGPFSHWEILQEGPLQSIFRLTYDSIQVADKIWQESITITVNAGSQVNKAEVVFTGEEVEGCYVGGGIFRHDQPGTSIEEHAGNVWMLAYSEPADSDKGIYKAYGRMGIDTSSLNLGENYVAVLLPNATTSGNLENTDYVALPCQLGTPFTYYFGGGWSQRDCPTREAWFKQTRQTAEALSHPLVVYRKL